MGVSLPPNLQAPPLPRLPWGPEVNLGFRREPRAPGGILHGEAAQHWVVPKLCRQVHVGRVWDNLVPSPAALDTCPPTNPMPAARSARLRIGRVARRGYRASLSGEARARKAPYPTPACLPLPSPVPFLSYTCGACLQSG